jgi:hypothetical protein
MDVSMNVCSFFEITAIIKTSFIIDELIVHNQLKARILDGL